MKIIDLLNKIANGEEVPNEFIYNGCLYENYQNGCYRHYDTENKLINNFVRQLCDDFCNLNDEVEILEEENKIPEKLETYKEKNEIFLESFCYKNLPIHKDSLSFNERVIVDKLNELIDYLKSKGE